LAENERRKPVLGLSEKESWTVTSGTYLMLRQPSTLNGLLPTTLEATPPMVAADVTELKARSAILAKLEPAATRSLIDI
jgi:hypothetical protein